ncbi:MAG: hypothetical protein EXS18_05585 [Verrucomicrobiae bacterium]|nr:hypothetical protein [Verrucomicrobiae bacterium]
MKKNDHHATGTPRPFELPWGKGRIAAEASIETPFNEPTLQLLEFEDGAKALRFCLCHQGDMLDKPVIVDEADLPRLRRAIQRSPALVALLKQLVE